MTLNGAIKQLHELRSAEDMPIYYKPSIAEIINVLLMDAREAKRGRWIEEPNCTYRCSQCGDHYQSIRGYMYHNFCPNCGADMRKGEKE